MKSKTGVRSVLMSEVRILGHMPKILGRSFSRMPLEKRKVMMDCMDSMVAVRRSGFWESALPASTPITSRHRIFSLNSRESLAWVGG